MVFVIFVSILVIYQIAYADINGDIDEDGKVSLSEAIYALQVTSGLKTQVANLITNPKYLA